MYETILGLYKKHKNEAILLRAIEKKWISDDDYLKIINEALKNAG